MKLLELFKNWYYRTKSPILGYIKGIDLSRYDTVKDAKAMKDSGIDIAIIRAFDGTHPDPLSIQNWTYCRAVGMKTARYMFCDFRYYADPMAQSFCSLVNGDWGDYEPAVDLEEWGTNYYSTKYAMNLWLQTLLQSIKKYSNKDAMLYCNRDTIKRLFTPLPDYLKNTKLWIADWDANYPTYAPFSDWAVWQYAGDNSKNRQHIPGLVGWADLNYFQNAIPITPQITLESLDKRLTIVEQKVGV